MSKKFEELQKRMASELSPMAQYPNTVLDKEIKSRNYTLGDYKLEFDLEWSGTRLYYQARFPHKADWDYGKSMELSNVIKKYPRFDLIDMKKHHEAVDIIAKRTPITPKMLYDNFIVFDNIYYEKRGIDGMLDDLRKNHTDYVPQWDGVSNSRYEAEEWFTERIVSVIGDDKIVFNEVMLWDGSDLLEEIGSKFFGASTD